MPEISGILTIIFNNSMDTGIVPSKLKIAKVTPIFKAGDSHDFNNYRPISILPSISKVLEKIIYNRLHSFITNHDILSPCQFGFRPKRSTYMAINDFYSKVTEYLDNKMYTVGIFLDLSKAFDTLNHDILLTKLNSYGIRGLANNWIRDYLSERKQYVLFNGESSSNSTTTGFNIGTTPFFYSISMIFLYVPNYFILFSLLMTPVCCFLTLIKNI